MPFLLLNQQWKTYCIITLPLLTNHPFSVQPEKNVTEHCTGLILSTLTTFSSSLSFICSSKKKQAYSKNSESKTT